MPIFEHPLGLFTVEYPEEWIADYENDSAALTLRSRPSEAATALRVLPLAVTGTPLDPATELAAAADRLGVSLLADSLETSDEDGTRVAYGEGARAGSDGQMTWFRFWTISRGTLGIVATQLGPGTALDGIRRAADATISSLDLTELVPPTPEAVRSQFLAILAREHPRLRAVPLGDWAIDVTDEQGQPLFRLNLEELYPECVEDPGCIEELIRRHLEAALRPEH
jgi:hypothetical protein